jgi:sugar fermentation stimulation protein A
METGEHITAHCANPGAMTGLNQPGTPVLLSKSSNPKRKLAWNFDLIELETGYVGINTSYPNKIVGEALASHTISEVAAYPECQPEVKYGQNSRVDFLLTGAGLPDCYLEVKNVHLSRTPELAEFPDSKTERGTKHLLELSNMVSAGHRAINLYLVQRTDCSAFRIASDIDPQYANAVQSARDVGVEILCYACDITAKEIVLSNPVPILFD